MLLAIDPGEDSGWALFDGKVLRLCGLGKPPKPVVAFRVVIEKPRIYPGAKKKARDADIITLAVRAGEWGGRYEATAQSILYVEPAKWKGGPISKRFHQPRIRKKLEGEERGRLEEGIRGLAEGLQHNVIDAVGIGLWAVGRAA